VVNKDKLNNKEADLKKVEAVSKVLFWILFPLCNFVLYFVILCGSMI